MKLAFYNLKSTTPKDKMVEELAPKRQLKDVRTLITGVTGFIGSHLTERLVEEGAEVSVIVRPGANLCNLSAFQDRVKIHIADIREREAMEQAVQASNPEVVYHLAAAVGSEIDATLAVEVNVGGTVTLLRSLEGRDIRCFLYVGTCHEYGNRPPPLRETLPPAPLTAYAASKAAAWLFLKMYHRTQGWPIVCVRPFAVYGPRQSSRFLIPQVILHALRREDFPTTLGEQGRDWIYVEDVVDGIIRASLSEEAIGQIINLCSGQEHTVREVVGRVLEIMGNPIEARFGALPYRRGEIWHLVGDNAKAKELLGWEPKVSLEEGLRRTIAWYLKRTYSPICQLLLSLV